VTSVSVCLSEREYVCGTALLFFTKFPNIYARYLQPRLGPPHDGVAMRCVHPVLRMTSYSHTVGHMELI